MHYRRVHPREQTDSCLPFSPSARPPHARTLSYTQTHARSSSLPLSLALFSLSLSRQATRAAHLELERRMGEKIAELAQLLALLMAVKRRHLRVWTAAVVVAVAVAVAAAAAAAAESVAAQ